MDLPLPELSSEGRKRRENAVPLVSDIVGGWGVLVSPLPAPSSAWFSCCSRSDEAKQNLLMLNHECIFIRLVWYKNSVFTWGTKTGRARTGSVRGDSFVLWEEKTNYDATHPLIMKMDWTISMGRDDVKFYSELNRTQRNILPLSTYCTHRNTIPKNVHQIAYCSELQYGLNSKKFHYLLINWNLKREIKNTKKTIVNLSIPNFLGEISK